MKTIKLMASMELIKLLELVVPMKMEKGVQYWFEWLNWGHGNYGTDGFNQINWSDGTNGTKCVRIDRAAGSVWFHWMRLSERMKCKHNELIELTICMVGGTESGARIYNTKIRRNRAAFPNSIKSRKVKGKDDKNLFSVQKHWYDFYQHWAVGGGVGGRHSLQKRSKAARFSSYFR